VSTIKLALEYVKPSEIDGTPAEVARDCRHGIAEIAAGLLAYVEEAYPQLRNAWQTEALNETPEMPPATLAAEWEASDAKAAIDRVQNLAAALERAVIAL
jgi:hypothetical protein